MISPLSPRFNTTTPGTPLQNRKASEAASLARPRFSGDSGDFNFSDYLNLGECSDEVVDFGALGVLGDFKMPGPDPVEASREKVKPFIEQLNERVISNKFPLEREIDPNTFTAQKLGDYIARQPRFEELLAKNPDGLKEGLETLVHLSHTLDTMPASHALRERNSYVQRHLSNHLLNIVLNKLLEDPSQANPAAMRSLMLMNMANHNASIDPLIRTEDRVLREIENHHEKLGLLQQTLDSLNDRYILHILDPSCFVPNPAAHPMLQKAQHDVHRAALEKSPNRKAQAVKELEQKALELEGLQRGERMRQQLMLHPIYSELSEHLRHKTCRLFTNPEQSHPLKNMVGFRHLWESLGGARHQVVNADFELLTNPEPPWVLSP